MNAIRAAVWRYGVTGEADIPGRIATTEGTLKQILKSTRDQVEDKEFRGGIDGLGSIIKRLPCR